MKILIFLMSTMAFCLSTNDSFAQETIYLDKNQELTPDQIFDILKKQTDYNFVYPKKLFLNSPKIKVEKGEIKISALLNKVLSQNGLNFKITNGQTVLLVKDNDSSNRGNTPQGFQVSGTVFDEQGVPLSGANVIEKGTSNGTQTDFDGNFQITVTDSNAILTLSYIGFVTHDVPVNGQNQINVTLIEDTAALDEVVVVGYGTQRKKDLTGSISSVSAKDLDKIVLVTPDQALQGRASGVQVRTDSHAPGGGISVQIRGTSSLGASSQPLYVIDGFPISNDYDKAEVRGPGPPPNQLNSIDPSNIESIQILKDASATAIYGSRANNGVVLITTKRGKSGKAQFEYESMFSVSKIREKMDLLNATEWMQLVNEGDELNGNTPRFTSEEVAAAGVGTDWQDVIFRNALTQRHKLSVSGGTDAVRYLVSANALDQEGVIIGTGFKRYGFNTNLDANISKKLTLNSNLSYTTSINDQTLNDQKSYSTEPSIISILLQAKPTVPAYEADGSLAFPSDYTSAGSDDTPLYMATQYDIVSTTSRFLGGMTMNYEIIEGLNFKVRAGMDNLNVQNNAYYPIESVVARASNGRASQEYQSLVNFLNEYTLEYKKLIGKHQFSVLGGYTYQTEKYRKLKAESLGFPSDFYGYHNLGLATNPLPPYSSTEEWTLISYLGRATYSFKDKYLFTATGRYDGSSKFGVNNKYGFFPSASAAWVLSEESFIQDLKTFSILKLRLGYGQTGNERIGLYKSIPIVGAYNDLNTGYILDGKQVPVAFPINLGNPDLTWEKGEDINIGLDMGFFDNRIGLTIDLYRKKTTDLLLNVPIPLESGYGSVLSNLGEIQNKGFELSLTTENIATNDFNWTTNINFSHNKNEITSLGGETDFYFTGWVGGANQNFNGGNVARNAVGHSVGSFWGSTYDGFWKSQEEIDNGHMPGAAVGSPIFRDVNNDGKYDANDDQYIGDPNPDFIFGIANNLTYKQFGLNFFIYGEQGQDLLNLTWHRLAGGGNLLRSDREKRWHPVNNPNGTTLPANQGFPGRVGTHNIEDGSFVRLKNVTLTYNLPVNDLGISFLKSLQLSLSADNLFLFTKYRGFDPEVNSYGSTNDVKGVDRFGYPSMKGFRAGLRVGF